MLTDKAVRAAAWEKKAYKLAESRGLHLHVSASGHKSWRYKYRFENKERLLTLGAYPEVSLVDAREKRDEAKKILRNGRDPRHSAKRSQLIGRNDAAKSFEETAREDQQPLGCERLPRPQAELAQCAETTLGERKQAICGQPADRCAEPRRDQAFENDGGKDPHAKGAHYAQERQIALAIARHSEQRDKDSQAPREGEQPGKNAQSVEARPDQAEQARGFGSRDGCLQLGLPVDHRGYADGSRSIAVGDQKRG